MYPRTWIVNRKRKRKDGTITIVKQKIHGWVKNKTIRRKQSPRGHAKTEYSTRFGYLNLYSWKEQQMLKCPSGYSVTQGMNKLWRLWSGYKRSKSKLNLEGMEHYARQIQATQEDMGLKTTSFPHLGIYGDRLIFYDHKGHIGQEIDHSHLKAKQKLEEAKERVDEAIPGINLDLLEEGEEVITIADEIPKPKPKYRIKHENRMRYNKKRDEDWICKDCDEVVLAGDTHICKRKEADESVVTMTDDIPFM